MSAINKLPVIPALGSTTVVKATPQTVAKKVNEIITTVNDLTDGSISGTDLTLSGDLSVGDDATITGDLTVTGTSTFNGTIVLGDAASDSLTINAATTYSDVVAYSNATGLVATGNASQSGALALTEEVNNVITITGLNNSVKLPAAVAGKHVRIKNSAASNLNIFPATSDAIDALAADLGVKLGPLSVADFYAIDGVTWKSNIDLSLTLNPPTNAKGFFLIKAADNTGDTGITITNAAQADTRTYTIPDAGATTANFIMSEGAQTINGAKTFGTGVALPDGTVGALSVRLGADGNNGLYGVSDTQIGIAVEGALVATADTSGLTADSLRNRVNLGTTPVGTVSIVEYSDGRHVTAELTLTNFIVGALAGAGANLGVGNIVYALPAGVQFYECSYESLALTATGTAVTPKLGLGSVIASGAVAVLNGTATFMDYHTEYTGGNTSTHAVVADGPAVVTAGFGTGIALQTAAKIKNVFLNAAAAWNADNTGNLTATGTVILKWNKLA